MWEDTTSFIRYGGSGAKGVVMKRHMVKCAGLVALVSMTVAACGGGGGGSSSQVSDTTEPANITFDPNGTLTVALDAEPPSLDPAGNSLSLANGSIYNGVYDTLMEPVFGKDPVPGLAETVTESTDRLSWTLKIRSGVTFHDGTPLDAAAVVTNIERFRASPYVGTGLTNIVEVDSPDAMTVVVKLQMPWAAFPVVLAGMTIASPNSVLDAAEAARNPVGTGPYVFKEWVPNDRVTLVRNEQYWNGTPRLASITFKFIIDETARLTAFQAGDVDAMTTIVQATVDEATNDGFRAVVPPITGYGLVHLNNKVEPLNDKRVRKAMELAVDHSALAEAFGYSDYDVEGYGILPPSNEWFSAPPEKPKFDLEGAKALLAEYGKPVKFTIKLLKGSQDIADSFDVMAEMWKEAGMDVTIESVPDLTSLITSVLTGDYEAAAWLAGISVDADLTFYPLLHTKGASNYSKYSSSAMDAAIEEGRSGATKEARMASYAKVQEIFRDEMPFFVTSHGQIRFLVTQQVAGMQASGFFPTDTAGVKAG